MWDVCILPCQARRIAVSVCCFPYVWQHVSRMMKACFRIDIVPHIVYVLCPSCFHGTLASLHAV